MAHRHWPPTTAFDIFDASTGAVIARNLTAASAATYLGVSADAVVTAIDNFSFLDGNGYRCAGHMQILGG
jgi:hypothetical protein